MAQFRKTRLRAWMLFPLLVISFIILFSCHNRAAEYTPLSASKSTFDRLDLTEEQCRSTFPLQFISLDTSITRGDFKFERSDPDYQGLVQARIKNNDIYILTTSPTHTSQILHQRTAILSQIHRALLTSPIILPDTYFAFTINDVPKNNTWGFATPNKNSNMNVWLMPTFAAWSWPKSHIAPMDDTLTKIDAVEANVSWDKKIDKIVWRGTPFFNPLAYPHLRPSLLSTTKNKNWANVASLNATNGLPIENFCRYKYIVYTEGVTYSGRLPYHQACESVLISAPLSWLTTSAMLMRPIWADDLMGDRVTGMRGKALLPTVESYVSANAIYVDPEFADVERLVDWLREHSEIAQRIAQNQRETVVGGGYLSIAAETCYWRALLQGWSKTALVDEQEWRHMEVQRYETWLLKEVTGD